MNEEIIDIPVEPVDETVVDETEKDTTVSPVQYEITSYGADIDTEGLVNRLRREDIYIPPFQRDYVWSQKEASRFIESLLLGLPVPGVFLARESDSKRLLVIDGQQRLKTLEFFFDGFFNPAADEKRKRVFDLQGVQKQFEEKTYATLEEKHRIALNDSIIHATIVKQESPKEGDQSSIYHIFERLNTSGRKLSPQQIRVAIYHGFFIEMLHDLNENIHWRAIFGSRSKTLKDEELILRFISMFYFSSTYTRPMKEFLNSCVEKLIKKGVTSIEEWKKLFVGTIEFIHSALGTKAFRPERAINAAVFDSVMVGLATRLQADSKLDCESFVEAYNYLLLDKEYSALVSQSTSDDANVSKRLELARKAFLSLGTAK